MSADIVGLCVCTFKQLTDSSSSHPCTSIPCLPPLLPRPECCRRHAADKLMSLLLTSFRVTDVTHVRLPRLFDSLDLISMLMPSKPQLLKCAVRFLFVSRALANGWWHQRRQRLQTRGLLLSPVGTSQVIFVVLNAWTLLTTKHFVHKYDAVPIARRYNYFLSVRCVIVSHRHVVAKSHTSTLYNVRFNA